MSRQDEIAEKAVRRSTLKSLKKKKKVRIKQLKNDYENAVREVNLQYAEDPERLKAKYAASDYAKNERAKRLAEKRIAAEKRRIEDSKKERHLTLSEEIGSSIVQGIGVALFIAATAILDTIAVSKLHEYINITIVFYSLFGAAMILMYLFSLLHHAIPNFTAKEVFKRLSHIWAFLIIGFGYSVYTITKIQGLFGWILFGIVWGIVFVGIMFYAISGNRFAKLNVVLYSISGFSGFLAVRHLYNALSVRSLSMLILGAVFYLLGIVFYNLKKVKYMHLISNILMLFASVYIFFSLFFISM
mgnify:CR=1 FL=1